MSASIDVLSKGTYILVTYVGDFTRAEARRCIDVCTTSCLDHGLMSAMLDVRQMTGDMTVMDRFHTALYGIKLRKEKIKTAMLADDRIVLPDKFFESVARNRGIRIRVFTDEDQAVAWLEGDTDRDGSTA